MKNPLTWRAYCRDPWWQAHEHHHLKQEREQFQGQTWRYILTIICQYIRYRSHDKAPMEIEANRAADEVVRQER